MEVERGLAGFALPFAAGVGAVVYLGDSIQSGAIILASMSFFICIIVNALMIYTVDSKTIVLYNYMPYMAGLTAGLMTGAGSLVLGVSDTTWAISEWCSEIGNSLVCIADRINFSSQDTNALTKALLTGDRSGLSLHTKEIFRQSGASHILALSGLHLGIIYGIISALISPIARTRKAKILCSIGLVTICGIYTMITGAGPSISRAFVFILLREGAKISFRSTDLKNILMASLIIHLATSPQSISSVGFQLSYAAMFGIAYIYPILKNIWPDNKEDNDFPILRKVWDIASLSIACQLTAGTVALIYFGDFPEYFIITNLIAMPLAGILIPLALFTLVLECMGISPGLFATATEAIANILTKALTIISSL